MQAVCCSQNTFQSTLYETSSTPEAHLCNHFPHSPQSSEFHKITQFVTKLTTGSECVHIISLKAFLHLVMEMGTEGYSTLALRSVPIYCRVVCLAWLKIYSDLFYPEQRKGKQCNREEVANSSQPHTQNQRTQHLIKYLLCYSETACRVQL